MMPGIKSIMGQSGSQTNWMGHTSSDVAYWLASKLVGSMMGKYWGLGGLSFKMDVCDLREIVCCVILGSNLCTKITSRHTIKIEKSTLCL